MKKKYFLLLSILFQAFSSFSQMYILNEDFTGTSGTIPPAGWTNTMVSGTSADLWHFDNPGSRTINYPVTEPFAIFDGEAISNNGSPESATLESPLFDASISNFILLNFQHTFMAGTGATGYVEAFNGSSWQQIASYSSSTPNPASEILDLSSAIGGITNARIRFTWSGNGAGYWAVDNIRIYASLPLDAGVVSLDNPLNPVSPGVHNVTITLGNFGYNTLSSTTIHWTIDGVAQPNYAWNGSIGFGQALGGIVIGSYNFQDPVMLKIWQSGPNGQADPNPFNDTITVFVKTTLCGVYTIGGTNPDFDSFSEVASVLNDAGITCPVTFLVRDGIYYDQFILRSIPGSSATNTVTFRSESSDSTAAILQISPGALKYESMILMEGTQHVIFEDMGLFTGSTVSYSNNAILMDGARDIKVRHCNFEVRNQFDFGILAQAGSQQIEIGNNRFLSVHGRAGAISMTDANTRNINIHDNLINGAGDWGYSTIRTSAGVRQLSVTDNQMLGCYRAVYLTGTDSAYFRGNVITNSNYGIYIDIFCSGINIFSNRLTGIKSHQNVAEGTAAVTLNEVTGSMVYNNFIQTTGQGLVMGISINKSSACQVHYNSVNISNTDQQKSSKGISLSESNNIIARNNIFSVRFGGIPVFIAEPSAGFDFNRNDYYNFGDVLGYYNGNYYEDLPSWRNATGLDPESISVIPFFTSGTDLSINQALLNNAGVPVAGITTDIDGTTRNPVNPDIGAREYNPCPTDAGVNEVTSPQNPLGTGNVPVKVILQNQGTQALTSVTINWSVNSAVQVPFAWSGNLPVKANAEVQVGTFTFQGGQLYTIKAWTSAPNGTSDCNHANDTIISPQLAAPLCGTYTIGGTSPDFATIGEAVGLLNLGGVTCPVEFVIRDGIYEEQFNIYSFPGSSAINTVTFRSESGDSSKAVIKIKPMVEKAARDLPLLQSGIGAQRQDDFAFGDRGAVDDAAGRRR